MDSTYLRVASTLIILVVTQQMMSGKQHCSAAAAIVTLLNGKSVSRVKSVFQGVKRFSMRDPFAPRMDHSYPSLRGQTMIHKWSKWITNGETSLLGRLISRKNHFYKLSMELCSTIALLTNEGGFNQLP